MPENIFSSILTAGADGSFSVLSFLLCTLCSLLLGGGIALAYCFRNPHNKGFVTTLALLPAIVQMVILLVNGNLGTGVAVMGAFSLIRFRSVPGKARDITSIFLAMAAGLATGIGYLAAAVLFTAILCLVSILYSLSRFGAGMRDEKQLKITIPESLDYADLFDDLFRQYAVRWELTQVKTCNLGSMYQLKYLITLKASGQEKAFLDDLRCRNGNLEIVLGRLDFGGEEL